MIGVCTIALSVPACLDFGYPVAPAGNDLPPVDAGSVTPPSGCVEEQVPPSAAGRQIHFITLNTDTPAVSISAGDVVTWTNNDTSPHTATAGTPEMELPPDQGGWSSMLLGQGEQWAYRFCVPRSYLWFCRSHPAQMRDYRLMVQ